MASVRQRCQRLAIRQLVLDVDGMTCPVASRVSNRRWPRCPACAVRGPIWRRTRRLSNSSQTAPTFRRSSSAVKRAGYSATPASTMQKPLVLIWPNEASANCAKWRRLLICGVVLLTPLVVLHFLSITGAAGRLDSIRLRHGLAVLCRLAVLTRRASPARHLSTNMDTLVTIGTLAAYGAGVYGLFGAPARREHAQPCT